MVEYLWGRHTLWYKKSILKWLNEEVCFFLGSTKCRQGDGPSQPLRPSQMLTENPQPHKGSALSLFRLSMFVFKVRSQVSGWIEVLKCRRR